MNQQKNTNPKKTNNLCLRCGTCCLKGGPALHQADYILIKNAQIKRSHLFSILKGELAYMPNLESDSSSNSLLCLTEQELIKIKPNPQKTLQYPWACMFLTQEKQSKTTGCKLHPNHPEECKLLFCQNTKQILKAYQINRLTRAELSTPDEQALQAAHSSGTNWTQLGTELATYFINQQNNFIEINKLPKKMVKELEESANFDNAFRSIVVERKVLKQDELDFHFGRNITSILKQFGIYL
ncbi:hypothetical protein [Desulfovibrio litoralis]|uniref:Zinc-or iron-chelating domain-containing protein n=1 Tax=Desulfovibrio litoralis DSM 11393 TaxID=1121455 RepID=A0A1M7SKV3_9BACT|nr:hypothetical protein [Desulfovibrio litoralis]SHN59109.1 hypothetical protein SAMN02745728_00968 [Desulfovibrio litoralis DSM 11393]